MAKSKIVIKHPGALHRALGVPVGQKIPVKRIIAKTGAPGKLGEMARYALALEHRKESNK